MFQRPTATAVNDPASISVNLELGTRLGDLDKLSDADRAALLHILDGLLANTRIRAALDNAG